MMAVSAGIGFTFSGRIEAALGRNEPAPTELGALFSGPRRPLMRCGRGSNHYLRSFIGRAESILEVAAITGNDEIS